MSNAVKDIKDLVEVLTDLYDVLPENIRLLFDEQATRDQIIIELDELKNLVEPDDKLIIYYSGHGHLDKNQKGYWIPTDAHRNNTAHYIRNSTIRDYIEDIPARHILLISDSCFSGSLFVRGASRAEVAIDELEERISRWALCSGRHDEEVYDGTPGENSPFAASILDILRFNRLPKLNIAKLADRVVDLTRANYRQLPEGNPIYGVGHRGGQYVFHFRAREEEAWAACREENTLQAYRDFLLAYPSGRFAGKAQEELTFHEEEIAWSNARKEHTILGYYQYAQTYSAGRYRREALEIIQELEEEKAWRQAQQKNTLSSFLQYTSDYPSGKYAKEAQDHIQSIVQSQQESRDWADAAKTDQPKAYRQYLEKYPAGEYMSQARLRLAKLEQLAEKKAGPAKAPSSKVSFVSESKQSIAPIAASRAETANPLPSKPPKHQRNPRRWAWIAIASLAIIIIGFVLYQNVLQDRYPDLTVKNIQLITDPVVVGKEVRLGVVVVNKGRARSKACTVAWWADPNSSTPTCVATVPKLSPREANVVPCSYKGYRRPLRNVQNRVVIDFKSIVKEGNEKNNEYTFSLNVVERPS